MWVLLLLGLLPLAILPSMLDGGSGSGGADDDDSDDIAASAGFGPGSGPDALDDGWMPDTGTDPAPPMPAPDPGVPTDTEDGDGESPEFVATTFAMAPGDGSAAFADFVPGEDRLEFHLARNGPEPEMTSGQGEDGAWVRVAQGDAMAEARFPGLTEPPLDDIHLVSGVLEPDLADDLSTDPSDPDDPDDPDQAGPLVPVTDDVDAPGDPDADDDAPVLSPVLPPEGGS